MESNGESDDGNHEALGLSGANAGQSESQQEQINRLQERNRELEEEVMDLRDELTGVKETLFSEMNDLVQKVEGADPTNPRTNGYYEDLTTLEKYQEMSEGERDELLNGSPSKKRAVIIFEHWSEWAQQGARRDEQLISTLHTRGRYNKLALKVDLQSATGEDLQNIEVYRAMKAVAKLSLQNPDDAEIVTDEFGREHITGGAFEFHEKVNPDSGKHFKVLTLAAPEEVMLP